MQGRAEPSESDVVLRRRDIPSPVPQYSAPREARQPEYGRPPCSNRADRIDRADGARVFHSLDPAAGLPGRRHVAVMGGHAQPPAKSGQVFPKLSADWDSLLLNHLIDLIIEDFYKPYILLECMTVNVFYVAEFRFGDVLVPSTRCQILVTVKSLTHDSWSLL